MSQFEFYSNIRLVRLTVQSHTQSETIQIQFKMQSNIIKFTIQTYSILSSDNHFGNLCSSFGQVTENAR